jgi:hypothetical protein
LLYSGGQGVHQVSIARWNPKGPCTKQLDSTSVLLRHFSDTQKPADWVNVDFINQKGLIYLRVRLTHVTIASHSFSNADNGPPEESFSLLAEEMRKEFNIINYSGVAQDNPAVQWPSRK